MNPIKHWVVHQSLHTVLDETFLFVLPIILRVKVVLSFYKFICLVDGCHLSNFHVADQPRNIRVHFNQILESFVEIAVMSDNYFN